MIGRRKATIAADVSDEVEHHIELRARRFIERGMPPDRAWAEARRRFGPSDSTHGLVEAAYARERRMHWTDWLEGLAADARYALRQLKRSPAFAATATITLALGIGANATMFGVIDRLLLQPPAHVVDPACVVSFSIVRNLVESNGAVPPRDTQAAMAYPTYQDLLRATEAFQRVAVWRARTLTLGSGLKARAVRGMATSASYFPTLGVQPEVGRFYMDEETEVAPGAPVVVLSHAFWKREFGGDARVIGQNVELAGTVYRIIGVAPQGFTGIERDPVDIWLPMTAGYTANQLAQWRRNRDSFFLYTIARLKPGMSIGTASRIGSAAVKNGYLADGLTRQVRLDDPGVALVSALPRDARGKSAEARVALLLGATALLVLVLTCANVANLQLARSIQRRREIAIRLALGVARRRLLRQLALDSVLLATLGGAAAIAIAYVGGEIGRRSLVSFGLGEEPLVDTRILAFTALLSLLTGLATGLVPAMQTTRFNLANWLRTGARDGGGRSSRLRFSLLIVQAGLTVVLLGGTGMFVLSLRRVQSVRLGVDPDKVAVASLVTTGRSYSPAERATMYDQLLAAAKATPGVESATLATTMQFQSSNGLEVYLPGRGAAPTTSEGGPYLNTVTADYFRTMGTRVIVGRSFTEADRAGSAPVAVVNQTAARLWWPGTSPIGKCMKIGADSAPCAEVVGVVENVRRFGVVEDEVVQFYTPIDQLPSEGPANALYVRTSNASPGFVRAVQTRLQAAAPGLPYVSVKALSDVIAPRMQSWRIGAITFAVFGVLAVVLASVGLYGVLAYDVAQRQQELGVRLALGASRGDVGAVILRRALVVVATGSAVGLAATLAGARFVGPLLFRTSPYDPLVLGGALVLVLIVSLLSTLIPASRAMRVDPAVALRSG